MTYQRTKESENPVDDFDGDRMPPRLAASVSLFPAVPRGLAGPRRRSLRSHVEGMFVLWASCSQRYLLLGRRLLSRICRCSHVVWAAWAPQG